MRIIGDARQVVERNLAIAAEGVHRLACPGVECEETIAAVQENVEPSVAAPERSPSELPAAGRQELSKLVRFAVESPQLSARLGIQRSNTVIGRCDVENTVDHQRGCLEKTRSRSVLLERRLPMLPLPRDVESLHVGSIDVRKRRIFGAGLIAAIIKPFHLLGCLRKQKGTTNGYQRH